MFYALGRGVPEAGVTFAVAMMLGVALTLSVVALAAVLARDGLTRWLTSHGATVNLTVRILDAIAGVGLIVIAAWALAR
jgi:nickel/cobalt exporter